MGLETGTYISDLVSTNPTATDLRSQGDDHLRLVKATLQSTFPNASKAFRFSAGSAKTADYTILSTDLNKFISMDATAGAKTFTLPTLSASDDGWEIILNKIDSSTNTVTISGTVNGASNPTLTAQWQSAIVWWSGTAWYMNRSVIASNIDYTALTALTAPANDDVVPIYDLSATANRKIVLSDLWKVAAAFTALTAPAVDDSFAMYDLSATAVKTMAFSDFLKVINSLTEDTTPDMAADYVLTYDASAGAVKKALPKNLEHGWTFLKAYTASSSNTIDFNSIVGDGGFDDTYDEYMIVMSQVKVSVDDSSIQLRVGTGGTPTYQSGASAYGYSGVGAHASDTGANLTSDPAASSITLTRTGSGAKVGNASGEHFSGKIYYANPDSTDFPLFEFECRWMRAAATESASQRGSGTYLTAGAITAIRLLPSSGNFVSGVFRLYGLHKT